MAELRDHFYLKLQIGDKITDIVAKIEPRVLEMSWEEFSHLYAEPAFAQLIMEMKYLLDSPADPPRR